MLDKVTEMVAHMIGIFHLQTEDQRMRDAYAAFKAQKADTPDLNEIPPIPISFKAPYDLGGFDPRIVYSDKPPPATDLDPLRLIPTSVDLVGAPLYVQGLPSSLLTSFEETSRVTESGFFRSEPILEPPGSVAIVTVQIAHLFDNDVLFMGSGDAKFFDPAVHLEHLVHFELIARTMMQGLDVDPLMPGPNARQDAIALHATLAAMDETHLSVTGEDLRHGSDAFGITENGYAIDSVTQLDDVMPAYLKDKAGTDSESDSEMKIAPDPFASLSKFDSPMPYRPDVDAQNLAVVGGNTMINQVNISSAWLDAPVIAVMGDAIHLNVIAQANLMVQHTFGGIASVLPSTSINSASMSFTATSSPEDIGEDSADTEPQLPSNWVVTRIEGDLIVLNHVSQYSFMTDHDRVEISFGTSNTYVGLGDNTIANLTDLAELGFGYDLIIVGGAMISVNWLKQMNVLIDNDAFTYSNASFVGFNAGISAGVHAGDNLAFNGAQISVNGIDQFAEMKANFSSAADGLKAGAKTIDAEAARDALFDGFNLLRVLYIEGDLTTINWLEQTNIMGDSDQVHLAKSQFNAAAGAAGEIITGSNAAINLASITQYGIDSTVMVGGDVYDDALLYQAELIDTDANPLGTMMPPLAPSAVLFLADGMLDAEGPQSDSLILPTPPEAPAMDIMQTMLA